MTIDPLELGPGEPLDLPALFGRAAPVELEIGSGKGTFLVQAAARWPGRDFLAVEQVRSLARKIASKSARAGLRNVRVLRCTALEALARMPAASVSRVHVYFPDPWPKRRHAKNRLFASAALVELLAEALHPGGELLLATDHDPYFREAVRTLLAHGAFVRTIPDAFREIPKGGFDAIFERAGVEALRGTWERNAGPQKAESPTSGAHRAIRGKKRGRSDSQGGLTSEGLERGGLA